MSADGDDCDDFDLLAIEYEAASTGAAADSSNPEDDLKNLPRLLRYAMLVNRRKRHTEERLVAEISELCPGLPQNLAWAAAPGAATGLALAAELDCRAVTEDKAVLRGLADCVRLLCLPVPRDASWFEDYRRVGKALVAAFRKTDRDGAEQELCSELEQFVYGWAALPACTDLLGKNISAARNVSLLGPRMAEHRVAAAKASIRKKLQKQEERRKQQLVDAGAAADQQETSAGAIPAHHLLVARLSPEEMKNAKLKDILGSLKSVINVALPLVRPPPLHEVRNTLIFEFPYAIEVIDFVLADLVGRETVHLRPLLIVGEPGGGKSRFARRVGEVVGVTIWREDGSRADGAVFGGTDRRWHSAEPCHPFLAVAQGRIANPLVLIDEIEKAATRGDYGRLWDCLLAFLEPETNIRYPDPALQTNLDLSQVSYLATANSLDPLPAPIRDRFRIIRFPKPGKDDLDALLPAVIADLTKERGLDSRWLQPLDGLVYAAVARHWPGGSVRRLRRAVEAILRERDLRAARH
jgi:ATP-dependent Lon protease